VALLSHIKTSLKGVFPLPELFVVQIFVQISLVLFFDKFNFGIVVLLNVSKLGFNVVLIIVFGCQTFGVDFPYFEGLFVFFTEIFC
jgi:hypothetical protein